MMIVSDDPSGRPIASFVGESYLFQNPRALSLRHSAAVDGALNAAAEHLHYRGLRVGEVLLQLVLRRNCALEIAAPEADDDLPRLQAI